MLDPEEKANNIYTESLRSFEYKVRQACYDNCDRQARCSILCYKSNICENDSVWMLHSIDIMQKIARGN